MDNDQLTGATFLIGLAVLIPAYWIIFRKTGLSPILSLLLIIPGIGWLVATAVLAFAKWPKGARQS